MRSFLRIFSFILIFLGDALELLYLSTLQLFIILAMIIYIPEITERLYHQEMKFSGILSTFGAVFSFQLNKGVVSALWIVPWVCVTTFLFVKINPFTNNTPIQSDRDQSILLVSSSVFYPGASLALLASRAGLQPFKFSHTIIELTAIHFHYVGIAIPVFIYYLSHTLDTRLRYHNYMISIGTPLVAIGITLGSLIPIVGLISVILFAGDLIWISILAILHYSQIRNLSILIAHLTLILSMLLAIFYATGVALPISTISISDMLITHGALNGLVVIPLSLIGWTRLFQQS